MLRIRNLLLVLLVLTAVSACSDDDGATTTTAATDDDGGTGEDTGDDGATDDEAGDDDDDDDAGDDDMAGEPQGTVTVGGVDYTFSPNCFGQEDKEVEAVGAVDGVDGLQISVYFFLDDEGNPGGGNSFAVRAVDGSAATTIVEAYGLDAEAFDELTIEGMHATGALTVTPDGADAPETATFDIAC